MNPITDDFLLGLAEIAAALIGLFLVGMVFYIQIGYEKPQRSRALVEPYFRAATSITFIAFSVPVVVSLTLVVLPMVWSVILYYALVLALILTDISTVATVRKVHREMRLRLLVMIEVVGSAVVVLMIALPLISGGLSMSREDLVPGILLSLGVGLLAIWVLVLTLFDIARFERSEPPIPPFGGAVASFRSRRNRKRPATTGESGSSQPTDESGE